MNKLNNNQYNWNLFCGTRHDFKVYYSVKNKFGFKPFVSDLVFDLNFFEEIALINLI